MRRGAGVIAAGAAGASGVAIPGLLSAAPKPESASETLAAGLFRSLSEEQRKALVFPFDDPLRQKVDNNWNITEKTVAEFFKADQQAMIRELFLKMHSEEYAETVMKQVEHDSGEKGFGASSVAFFGEPDSPGFEFVLTGRHCTRRCDGNTVEGAAFGGPIFYGHAAEGFNEKPDHPGNAYWFQAKRANELFQMLDGKQRETALLGDSRGEHGTDTVKLSGKKEGLPGLPFSGMSSDQVDHARKVLRDLLAPFRAEDAEEAMQLIEANGFGHLHIAFYRNENIGGDTVWDVWQIEGPSMVWYFRGDPHVHVWAHVREAPLA